MIAVQDSAWILLVIFEVSKRVAWNLYVPGVPLFTEFKGSAGNLHACNTVTGLLFTVSCPDTVAFQCLVLTYAPDLGDLCGCVQYDFSVENRVVAGGERWSNGGSCHPMHLGLSYPTFSCVHTSIVITAVHTLSKSLNIIDLLVQCICHKSVHTS